MEVKAEEQNKPSESITIQKQTLKEPVGAVNFPENKNKQNTKISLEKVKGKVSLDKSQKPVIIEKTPEITATVSWKTGLVPITIYML